MGDAAFKELLACGLEAEEVWARMMAARGHHAMRIFPDAASDNGARIYTRNGELIAPDVVTVTEDGRVIWFEVKSKTCPGYRYFGDHRGWEHGINWRNFKHYGKLAERAQVNIVVREKRTPATLELLDLPPKTNGKSDFRHYESFLVERETWRWISYQDALQHGRRQENWQKGFTRDGNEFSVTGWLWPLDKMTVFDGKVQSTEAT
jgi:hypothetical protein